MLQVPLVVEKMDERGNHGSLELLAKEWFPVMRVFKEETKSIQFYFSGSNYSIIITITYQVMQTTSDIYFHF